MSSIRWPRSSRIRAADEVPSGRGPRWHPHRQVPGRVAAGGQVVAQVPARGYGHLAGRHQLDRAGGRLGPAAHGQRQRRRLARVRPGNRQRHPDRGQVHRDRQVPGRRRALPVQPVAGVDRLHRLGAGTGARRAARTSPQRRRCGAECRQVDKNRVVLHPERSAVGLLQQVGEPRGGDAGEPHPGGDRPPAGLPQPHGDGVTPGQRPRPPGGERVPARLQRAERDRGRLHRQRSGPGRLQALARGRARTGHGEQVVVVVLGGQAVARGPPVAGPRGQRVLERMAPVLPGEAAAVRRRAAVPVDPDPGRPGAARAHQRQVQRPVRRDHAAGRAPVQHRDRAVRQGDRPGEAGLAVHRVAGVHHRVGQVAGQAGDRRGQVARQDQHRQVAGPAHVGVRAERVGPVPGHRAPTAARRPPRPAGPPAPWRIRARRRPAPRR